MKLITDKENADLHNFETNLNVVCKNAKKYQDLDIIIRDKTKCIQRDIFQFKAAATIVIVVGMLKAGKSTLINLLSRNEKASPVGFGIDTTLRPALILMAKPDEKDEGVIRVYSKQGGKEDEQLQNIFDSLRGINPEAESKLNPNQHPLTSKNLNDCLCKQAGFGNSCLKNEPLLVVVRLPYNEDAFMLKEGRMLLDMPGLDSANAIVSLTAEKEFGDNQIERIKNCMLEKKVDKSALIALEEVLNRRTGVDYLFLVEECDLVLCIQSSVAPLNDKAVDYLNQILENRDEVTTFIVQNTMVNQPWLDDSVLEEDGNKQLIHARKTFRNLHTHKGNLCEGEANLGMAYAGIFKHKPLKDGYTHESLESQSKFKSLEQKLQDCFSGGNSKHTRRSHCLQALGKDLSDFANEMRRELIKISSEDEKLSQKKNLLKGIKKDLNEYINGVHFVLSGDLSFVSDNLIVKFHSHWKVMKQDEKYVSAFQQLIEQEEDAENGKKKKRKKVRAEIIDNYANDCIEACHQAVETFMSNFKIQSVRMKDKTNEFQSLADICNGELDRVYDRIKKGVEERVKECSLNFPSNGRVDPDSRIVFSNPMIPKFVMQVSYSQSGQRSLKSFFWHKFVDLPDERKITEHITEMKNHYDAQIIGILHRELQAPSSTGLSHEVFVNIVKENLKRIFGPIDCDIDEAIRDVDNCLNALTKKNKVISDILDKIIEGEKTVSGMKLCGNGWG